MNGHDGGYSRPMGLTSVHMQVANFAAPEIAEEVEFLVDSGAIYSVVPGEIRGSASRRAGSGSSTWRTRPVSCVGAESPSSGTAIATQWPR